MKTHHFSKALALILVIATLAASFSAFSIGAEEPVALPTSKIDTLFTEEGYGFENFSGKVASSEEMRNAMYLNSGLYYQNRDNGEIRAYNLVDGKLVEDANGEDQKLYLKSVLSIVDPYAVESGVYPSYPDSRYLNDILCSDTGYSKYTLEMDIAVNGDFRGTNDANSENNDFSPYRGFSLLYLFGGGYTIKATGMGVGTSITYDDKLYIEDGTTDTYLENSEKGSYRNVISVDETNAKENVGYLYIPATATNYIKLEETEANAALGTKSKAQSATTWDTTAAIDFNKIAAAGLTPVPYEKGVEKTLKIDFTVKQVAGKDNDIYTATLYYGGLLLGSVEYTATAAARKSGIKFMDRLVGVTIDNIKLSIDKTSEFRSHPLLSDYQNDWSLSYWDAQATESWRFAEISNTYNNFSAKIYCTDCDEFDYVVADAAIQNGLADIVGDNSYTFYDSQGIIKGNKDYFIVTDLNTEVGFVAPTETKTLISVGGAAVLQLGADGKLALDDGTSFGEALTAKNSYTVAVRAIPTAGKYQVYVDGVLAGTGKLSKATNVITLSAFAGVRLLSNKAITVTTENPTSTSGIFSLKNASATYCSAHKEPEDKVRIFHKTPAKTDTYDYTAKENNQDVTKAAALVLSDLAYSYICTDCGQRAYVELGNTLVSSLLSNAYRVAAPTNDFTITLKAQGDDVLFINALPNTTTNTSPAFRISYDYTTGSTVTTVNDKNFLNILNGYNSQLRYYYNSTDGTYLGNKKAGGEKIISLTPNTTYKFAIRIHPSKTMDVWLDGKLIYSSSTIDNGQNNQIRLGMYGSGTISNLAAVQEAHTCTTDIAAINQGRDSLGYSFNCCGKTYNYNINKALANDINNMNSKETVSFTSASEYWIATDVNLKDTTNNGALLTLGADSILSLADGKLVSGEWVSESISAPTTYSVAAKIKGKTYDLYVEGQRVTSGALSASGATALTFGDDAFGYDVRFNYNKIVTLGTNKTVVPTFTDKNIGTVCYHMGTEKLYEDFSTKLVPEKDHGGNPNANTNVNLLYATYICTGCGERVYDAEQGDNLHNVNPVYYDGKGNAKASVYNANESTYNGKTISAMSIKNGSFTRSGTANIYTNQDIVGNPDSSYWFSFTFNMIDINTEKVRTNNGEANFLNIMVDYNSLLRVYTVPNTVNANTPLSSFKTSGKDYKITDPELCSKDFLLLRSKKTGENIGLLYIGAKYDITIHVTNGKANVYANNQLMVHDAAFIGGPSADNVDRVYSFRLFDQPSGNYQFTNYAFVKDADSYVDFDGMGVIEAEVTHTAVADATTYTSVFNASTNSILAINDANGELVIPNGDGTYTSLYTHDGQKVVIGSEATKVALVNNGDKFNYYVNETLVRTSAEGAETQYAQDIEHAGTGFTEVSLGKGVKLTGNYGFGGSGTSEYVGYQKRVEAEVFQNQIRIIAGLNSPYYGNVGFKVTNAETGKAIESPLRDTNIYSSVIADNQTVYASDFGYTYFSILEIRDIDMTTASTTKLSVIPYTTTGKKVVEGEEVILTITIAIPDGESEYAITIE